MDPVEGCEAVQRRSRAHTHGGAGEVAQLGEGAGLDPPPLADDGDPVGQRLHLGEDVAGEQDRAAHGGDVAYAGLEHRVHQRVQARGRLVEEVQLDVGGEGGDQRDLLPVALGVGGAPLGRVELEPLDQLATALFVQPTTQLTEEVDRLASGQVGPQVHVAGDVGQAAVQGDGVTPGVPAEQHHLAVVTAQQPQQDADRGGLAGTVGAEEAVDLADSDVEVEAVEGRDRTEGLGQAGDVDGAGGHRRILEAGRGREPALEKVGRVADRDRPRSRCAPQRRGSRPARRTVADVQTSFSRSADAV